MGKFAELMEVELDEKLKVLARGVTASGETHSGEHVSKTHASPSRMSDEHKHTEYGQSHRKDAAEKIRAHRKDTGQPGTKPFKHNDNFAVYKEDTQVDEKHKPSAEDHANTEYHNKMAKAHKEQAEKHYAAGKSYDDAHRIASLYHNGAAAEHEYAAKAHQGGSALKHQYSDHARERTAIANAKSEKAKG